MYDTLSENFSPALENGHLHFCNHCNLVIALWGDNEAPGRELCLVVMRPNLDCILSVDTLVKDAAVTE